MTAHQISALPAKQSHALYKKKLLARYRRMLVILLALVVILFTLLLVQGIRYSASAEDLNRKTYQSVTLRSGDSLWTIAQQYKAKGMDTRRYVSEIKALNRLSSNLIISGQSLILPIYKEE